MVNYDYVVDFDNLHTDGNRLLEYLQRNDLMKPHVMFDESSSSRTNSTRVNQYFKDIKEILLQRIINVYRYDFTLFDYPMTL